MAAEDVFASFDDAGIGRALFFRDVASGLRAVLVIDDMTLGPAAGGVRTRAYASLAEALADAAALARAMTEKCALAQVAAGGGKTVVLDHPGLDRPAAFARLGEFVADLGGRYRTAGDLGTTAADLAAMAENCAYVYTEDAGLAEATADGLLACIRACARRLRGAGAAGEAPDVVLSAVPNGGASTAPDAVPDAADLHGMRVAIQGCGAIGAAAARALAGAGATLLVADVDATKARAVAAETGAALVEPGAILTVECDIVSPCAIGGVLDEATARGLRARAVCGAANNIIASASAERILMDRGIGFIPDTIASAGATVLGIAGGLMGEADVTPRLRALGTAAGAVWDESAASSRLPTDVAQARAWAYIDSVRARRSQRA